MGEKIKQKNCECESKAPHKTNAVIKLHTDETSHVSAGVKGTALVPLAQNSLLLSWLKSSQKSLSTHPPPHSTRVKPLRV